MGKTQHTQYDENGNPIVVDDPVSMSFSSDNEEIILPDSVNGKDRFISIEKITPETISPLVKRDLSVESIVEVVDRNFSYPLTAHVGLKFDSRTFSNVPKREYDTKMKKVKIPSNYYPLGGNGLDRRYVYSDPNYGADANDMDVIFMIDQKMDFAARALLKRNLKNIISKLISGYKYVRASVWSTRTGSDFTINSKTGAIASNFIPINEDFFEIEVPDSDGVEQTNLYKILYDQLSVATDSASSDEVEIANFFLRKNQFSITNQSGREAEALVKRKIWVNSVRKVVYFSGSQPQIIGGAEETDAAKEKAYNVLLNNAREGCINFYYIHNDPDFESSSGTKTLRDLAEDTGGGKFSMRNESDAKLSQFCDNYFYDSYKIYYGDWDGTFKIGWTDNPAWVLYDIITDANYGLGNHIDPQSVDKWTLYDIGRYCDAVDDNGKFKGVPDGQGGLEPRYTCNIIFYNKDQAYNILKDIAAIFKGIVFWNTEGFSFFVDRPKQPLVQFTNTSVKDGIFNYTETARNLRYTSVEITYNDRFDSYKTKIEYVEDVDGIRKYGLNPYKVNAAGCTSRSEAKRIGRYVLATSVFEVDTVSFVAGLEGAYLQPGDLFAVADEVRNTARNFGRILETRKEGNDVIIKIDGEYKEGLSTCIYAHVPSGNFSVSDLNSTTGLDGGFTGTLENIRARRQSQLKKINIKSFNNAGYGCDLYVTGEFLINSAIIDLKAAEGRVSGLAGITGQTVLTGITRNFDNGLLINGNPTTDTLTYSAITGALSNLDIDIDFQGAGSYGQIITTPATNWSAVVNFNFSSSPNQSKVLKDNDVSPLATASSEIRAVRLSSAGAKISESMISSLNDLWSSQQFDLATDGDVIIVFSNGSQISNSFSPNSNWNSYAATEIYKIGKGHSGSSSNFGYCAAFIKGGSRILERASKNEYETGSIKFTYRDLLALSKLQPYYTILQADVGNRQQGNFISWEANRDYALGTAVKYLDIPYYCKVSHRSSSYFSDDYQLGSNLSKWSLGSNLGYSTVGFPKDFYGTKKISISQALTKDDIKAVFTGIGMNKIYQGDGPLGESDLRVLSEADGVGYSGILYGTGYPVGFYNLDIDTSPKYVDYIQIGSAYVLSGVGVEPKLYKTLATKEEESNSYGIMGIEYLQDKENLIEKDIMDYSPSIYNKSVYDKELKPKAPTDLTFVRLYQNTGIDLSWTAPVGSEVELGGYKVYISRPNYSSETRSALTEFVSVPAGSTTVTIPTKDIYGQYDFEVFSKGPSPYKFLSHEASQLAAVILPQSELNVTRGGTQYAVDRLLLTGMSIDTADQKSISYNVLYNGEIPDAAKKIDNLVSMPLVGYGQGNFTSEDVVFRWNYIDPIGKVVSSVESMRQNPFIASPPDVKLEIVTIDGQVLETVQNYPHLSYKFTKEANKRLFNKSATDYSAVDPSRQLGIRITVGTVQPTPNGTKGSQKPNVEKKRSYGRYNAFNMAPAYSNIQVIDSFQKSSYYIMSGYYGNSVIGSKLAVWNSGTDFIVTGSGMTNQNGDLLRAETEKITFEQISGAFKSATGINASPPHQNGVQINYRGSPPDYEAYVNYYADLANFYEANVDKSKSKETFGFEHYRDYGSSIENRILPTLNDGKFGDSDLSLITNRNITGFSGISFNTYTEPVSLDKIIFNCFSTFSNKDVYKIAIYTGSDQSFEPDVSNGTNLLREYEINKMRSQLNVIELNDPVIPRLDWVYYKFLPYDDFGAGVMSAVVSGYLDKSPDTTTTSLVNTIALNGGDDETIEINSNLTVSTYRYKIKTLGSSVNWTSMGATTAAIGIEFVRNTTQHSGTGGGVTRVGVPKFLSIADSDRSIVFTTQSNSTVILPGNGNGIRYQFYNAGQHTVYIKSPNKDTANGSLVVRLLKKESADVFMHKNGEWVAYGQNGLSI